MPEANLVRFMMVVVVDVLIRIDMAIIRFVDKASMHRGYHALLIFLAHFPDDLFQ